MVNTVVEARTHGTLRAMERGSVSQAGKSDGVGRITVSRTLREGRVEHRQIWPEDVLGATDCHLRVFRSRAGAVAQG